MTNLIRVMQKARKYRGFVYPEKATEFSVEIAASKITIFKDTAAQPMQQCKSFTVGDTAEYDSYNLKYLGTITKITSKAVTIVAYKGYSGMEKTHRLDLNEFCLRNYDMDVEKVTRQNQEEMMYI